MKPRVFAVVLATSVAAFVGPRSGSAQSPAVITANPYLGMPISQFDSRVNRYSPYGALNPYTMSGGRIFAQDGTYLGRLNSNPYDPESVVNPFGRYGSPYSPTSINNPYSPYGSPYSSLSPTNPYATTPPIVIYPHWP